MKAGSEIGLTTITILTPDTKPIKILNKYESQNK